MNLCRILCRTGAGGCVSVHGVTSTGMCMRSCNCGDLLALHDCIWHSGPGTRNRQYFNISIVQRGIIKAFAHSGTSLNRETFSAGSQVAGSKFWLVNFRGVSDMQGSLELWFFWSLLNFGVRSFCFPECAKQCTITKFLLFDLSLCHDNVKCVCNWTVNLATWFVLFFFTYIYTYTLHFYIYTYI